MPMGDANARCKRAFKMKILMLKFECKQYDYNNENKGIQFEIKFYSVGEVFTTLRWSGT